MIIGIAYRRLAFGVFDVSRFGNGIAMVRQHRGKRGLKAVGSRTFLKREVTTFPPDRYDYVAPFITTDTIENRFEPVRFKQSRLDPTGTEVYCRIRGSVFFANAAEWNAIPRDLTNIVSRLLLKLTFLGCVSLRNCRAGSDLQPRREII